LIFARLRPARFDVERPERVELTIEGHRNALNFGEALEDIRGANEEVGVEAETSCDRSDRRQTLVSLLLEARKPSLDRQRRVAPIGKGQRGIERIMMHHVDEAIAPGIFAGEAEQHCLVIRERLIDVEVRPQVIVCPNVVPVSTLALSVGSLEMMLTAPLVGAPVPPPYRIAFGPLQNLDPLYVRKRIAIAGIVIDKDEAVINLSKLASAQIKEHIDLIETIQKQLKT